MNWADMLPKMKVNGQDTLLVTVPSFFASLDSILTRTAVKDLKNLYAMADP